VRRQTDTDQPQQAGSIVGDDAEGGAAPVLAAARNLGGAGCSHGEVLAWMATISFEKERRYSAGIELKKERSAGSTDRHRRMSGANINGR
jgi:hypothetical protein